MSWFTKYRPYKIEDLDLEKVRTQLLSFQNSGFFPQVMIFAGPKGTGKTTSSRIIGAILNSEQNKDLVIKNYFNNKRHKKPFFDPDINDPFIKKIIQGNSFVVREIDAASNRGIDDIRSLKQVVFMPPTVGTLSVFIFDEVHMLTNEAFNALLKLLEEPPSHAIFILATTEFEKIPKTIVSRASVINFYKASVKEIKRSLKRVIQAEDLTVDEDALSLIIESSDGSFRDAVKLLELSVIDKTIKKQYVEQIVGIDLENVFKQIINTVIQKDETKLLSIFEDLRTRNITEDFFKHQFFKYLHDQVLVNFNVLDKNKDYDYKIVKFFLDKLFEQDLKNYSQIYFLDIELVLLSIIEQAKRKKKLKNTEVDLELKKQTSKKTLSPIDLKNNERKCLSDKNQYKLQDNKVLQVDYDFKEIWKKIIFDADLADKSLGILLKTSRLINFDDKGITLGFVWEFHLEQLKQRKFQIFKNIVLKYIKNKDFNFNFLKVEDSIDKQILNDKINNNNKNKKKGFVFKKLEQEESETNTDPLEKIVKDYLI